MGFELREALRRLCVEIGWSYAVFWRAICSPTPKYLVWEDGYWHGKPQFSGCEDVNSHVNLSAKFRTQEEVSIDVLVSKIMAPQVHIIGDGIVGQAASIGNHRWILGDTSEKEPILSHLVEFENQFVLGIQTIVIIPVLPHGVLQFGSTMRVMENNLFVNHVKTSFMQLVCEQRTSYGVLQEAASGRNNLQHDSNFQFRDDCSNIDKSLSMKCNRQLSISSASRSFNQTSSSLSTNKIVSSASLPVSESCHLSGSSLFQLNNRLQSGLVEAQVISNRATPMPSANVWDNNSFNKCYDVENVQSLGAEIDSSIFHLSNEKYSPFLPLAGGSGDDLFDDVFGLSGSLAADVPSCNTQMNLPPMFYSVDNDLFSESNTDQLLDAVVSKKINLGGKISGSSLYCASSSNDESASSGRKHAEAAASTSLRSADSSDKLFDSHIKMVNRKRPRPGETTRPRPKDRQLIMDRVKELREIVPNCAKCSIDALLEKTIKHMLFLQSVAKHTDKLRDCGEAKVLWTNNEGGATWAYEVGSQPTTCPIIVEDINPPREMLVEMLCEERGIFLEIADLIKGLGFTILKGVMEARKNKIWARFAVEANRDVTRMEVFLSLVQSLEPSLGCGAISNMTSKVFNPSCVTVTGLSHPLLQ